ncbi:MAG: hypothetical protein RM368_32030 [Nostoc sp. DedSLP03]|uniref:hypothetical protein n=1 Tax=Nostoc sp. DedSLP03 TaxID=3075400 RepID=UPI002AD43C17|nr:hypothetical protein [Nostoc sp. DedSLP03]MDZ7969522.1 hypothetical protein [Nostoc sp. DedSLP03]
MKTAVISNPKQKNIFCDIKINIFTTNENKMNTQHLLKHISQQKIVIAATFTTESIEDSLSYWLQEIEVPYAIEFAPYNQVFQ